MIGSAGTAYIMVRDDKEVEGCGRYLSPNLLQKLLDETAEIEGWEEIK
jgi:hypothetical protein